MLRRDGESLRTRNCVFAICLAITKERDCFRSRDYGVDGCKRSHRKLLHLSEDVTNRVASVGDANVSNISSLSQRVIACENTAGTTEQGFEEHSQITTLTSAQYKEVVSLRTLLVWLKSKGKKLKSTQSRMMRVLFLMLTKRSLELLVYLPRTKRFQLMS